MPKNGSPNEHRKLSESWHQVAGWVLVIPLLIVLWETGAYLLNQPWILPRFSLVARQLMHPFQDLYASGSLASNTLVSFVRVLIGFLLAAIFGIPLGLLMGSTRAVRGLLEPIIELLRPLCPIAWIPFALAVFKLQTLPQVFGIRASGTILDQVQTGMVFVLSFGAFFPIVVNTLDGVSGVRRNYLMLAKTLGASRRQTFLHVYLPAALPMILTGLRQGIGLCWFVIIAAEMLPGANSGIGYLLMYAADQSGMNVVIASMIIIATIGALLNTLMVHGTKRLIGWYGKEF